MRVFVICIYTQMNPSKHEYHFEAGEVILLDKPLKWTSFDLVKRVRSRILRQLGIKKIKVGHAGTLDPLATGLMIICTGKATKQIDTFLSDTKEYIAKIYIGATTPTYDLESTVDKEYPSDHVTREVIEAALAKLTGEIEQIPPIFSAIKIEGQRAYDLARDGKEVEMSGRKITIFETEIVNFEMPYLEVRIACSKGTYIRSFARDIGELVESGAYLAGLIRTKIGPYSLTDAFDSHEFLKYLENSKQNPNSNV